MDDTKWESVLIEWVNCLKLSQSIQNIEELRDGDFFRNLLKVIKKTTKLNKDPLSLIFELFNEHYPQYSFSDISNVHLNDLPLCDLNSITSLLMHYTCIHDRRDVLTSPLCHSLRQCTQISIRNFLQKIDKNITNEELKNIIEMCLEATPDNSSLWLSSNNSPKSMHSPLLDILKTPSAKFARLHEKDREIAHLRSELELERGEKTDLQEELKLQNEKNKKLEQQLSQKKCEISRLRSEVVALENRTPPHYQDIDSREIQKRLRCEIQTLEQYVQQCDLEEEQLRKEKDSAKELARKLESQCAMWQEKCLVAESKLQVLQEHSNEQETTLTNLKIHCNELENLLDEFRTKPSMESFIEDSFQYPNRRSKTWETAPYEDLARSVVEVQLREAQKQNEELQMAFKEAREAADILSSEKEALHNEKEELKHKFSETEKLLSETRNTLDLLGEKNVKMKEDLRQYSNEIFTLKEVLSTSQADLRNSNDLNSKLQKEIDNLNTKIVDYLQEIKDYALKNDELQRNCDQFEKVVEKLNGEINLKHCKVADLLEKNRELVETVMQVEKEVGKITVEKANAEKEILNFINLNSVLCGEKANLEMERNIIVAEIKRLNQLIIEKNSSIEQLEKNCVSTKERNRELEGKLCDLNNKLERTQSEKLVVEDERTKFKKEIGQMNDEFVGKNKDLDDLRNKCLKLSDTIEEISKEKGDLQQKEKHLDIMVNKFQIETAKLHDDLAEKNRNLEELQSKCLKLSDNIQEVIGDKTALQEKEKQLQKNVNKLQIENEQLHDELEGKNKDHDVLLNKCLKLRENIQQVAEEKASLQEQVKQLHINVDHLEKENKNYKLVVTKSEEEIKLSFQEKKKMEKISYKLAESLNELENKTSKIVSINGMLNNRIINMEGELKNILQNQLVIEKHGQTLKDENMKFVEENAALKTFIDEINEEIKELQTIKLNLSSENDALKEQIENFNTKMKKLTENYSTSMEDAQSLKENLTEVTQQLEEMEKVHSDLKIAKGECEKDSDQLRKNNQRFCEEIECLRNNYADLLVELKEVCRDKQNSMTDLEECKTNFNTTVLSLNKKMLGNDQEISRLRQEVSNLMENLKANEKEKAEITTKLEQLDGNLKEKTLNYQKELQEIANDKARILAEHSKLEAEFLQLNNESEEVKIINSQLESERLEIVKENEGLKSKLKTLEDEIDDLRRELSECMKNCEDLSEKKSNLTTENVEFSEKIKSLTGKVNELTDQIKNSEVHFEKEKCVYEKKQANLTRKLSELLEEVKSLTEKIATLEAELLKVSKDKFEVILKNSGLESTVQELKNQVEETQNAKISLESNIVEFEQRIKDLRQTVQCCNGEIEDLKSKCLILEKDKIESFQENVELMKKYSKLENEHADLGTEMEGLCGVIKEMKTRNSLLELEMTNGVKENSELTKKMAGFVDYIEENKQNYERLTEEYQKVVEEKHKVIEEKQKSIEQLTKTIEEQSSDFCNQVLQLTTKNSEICDNQRENLRQIQDLQENFVNVHEKLQKSEIMNLQLANKITLLEEYKTNLERDLSECKITIADLSRDNENLKKDKLLMEKHLDEHLTKITELETKNNDLCLDIKAHLDEIKTEAETKISLVEKLAETEENYLGLQKEKAVLEKSISEQTEKIEELNRINVSLEEKCSKNEENLLNITSMLCRKNEELNLLILNLKSCKINKERPSNVSANQKSQEHLLMIENYETQTMELINHVRQLENDVESLNDYKQECLLKIENLQADLDEYSIKYAEILQEYQEYRSENEAQVTDLTKNLHNVVEKYNQLEDERNKLAENYESVISEHQAALEDKQTQIGSLRENFDRQIEELTKSKSDENEEALRKVSEKLQIVEKSHQEIQPKYQKLQEENNAFVSERGNLKKNLYITEGQNKKLTGELKQYQVKVNAIQERSNKLTKEKEALQQTITQLQADLAAISADNLKTVTALKEETKQLKITLHLRLNELQKVKKERNDIIESQTKIMKETEDNILRAHENAVEVKSDLRRRVDDAENEKQREKNLRKLAENDLQKLREAYGNVMSINSKMELENVTLRKVIEERNMSLKDFSHVKEAYEKLLEENNKLMMEVDTIKYKRARDRDEFTVAMDRERRESAEREHMKVMEVRNDYEGKLERMKDKMLRLYRNEVDKANERIAGQEINNTQKTMDALRCDLFEAQQKNSILETKLEMALAREAELPCYNYSSRESLFSKKRDDTRSSHASLKQSIRSSRHEDYAGPGDHRIIKTSSSSINTLGNARRDVRNIQERKVVTLPRSSTHVYEETVTTTSKRTSIVPNSIGQNIQMEDEEDLFNDKFLTEMKEGRCRVPAIGRESTSSRYSELAWRNSMVPPHLKSSYPAETQFVSPSRFKEEDFKSGHIDLDDSMCKLLPGEKPRQRKDFGTTSYKRPGPPTPSKNGGRLSLQGNEVNPLREHNEGKTPKKVTPSRLKDLFRIRNTSSKDNRENSESQVTTPRTKRLSIFRKQK